MTDKTRRQALKHAAGSLCIGTAATVGWLGPRPARAAWPKEAFEAKTTKELMASMFPGVTPARNDALTLVAPELAENGTVVPVTVQSTLQGVESFTLIADGNPRPLVATFTMSRRAQLPVTVRMKLAKSQDIVVVARTADGRYHTATRPIRVSIGGCGG